MFLLLVAVVAVVVLLVVVEAAGTSCLGGRGCAFEIFDMTFHDFFCFVFVVGDWCLLSFVFACSLLAC